MAGTVVGGAYWSAWRAEADAVASLRGDVSFWAASDASPGRFGSRVDGVIADTTGRECRVQALFDEGKAPEAREVVRLSGSISPPRADERGRRLHRRGCAGTVRVRTIRSAGWPSGVFGAIGRVRARAVQTVDKLPGEAGALVAGVVLGDRRRLAGTPAETDFRTTGLSHLVAVSGSHLVVVASLIVWALTASGVGLRVRSVAVLSVMGAYVVATGMQASAVRALAMTGVAILVTSLGRRADRVAALSAAACAALIMFPPVAFDLGFMLSVAAVGGLTLFSGLASRWFEAALPGPLRALAEPLSLTVVAQLATMPVAVPIFGSLSLIAPVANLIAGPLVSVMLVTGLVGLVVRSLEARVGEFLLGITGSLAAMTVAVASRLARVPAAAVPVEEAAPLIVWTTVTAAVIVWAVWPAPRRDVARLGLAAAMLLSAAVGFGPPARGGAEVVVLDVGQGDAILVRDGPAAALVDTGPNAAALASALRRHGVRQLDFVVLTHAHDDHTGGVATLAGLHKAGALYVPAGGEAQFDEAEAMTDVRAVGLAANDRLTVGSVTLTVLWPRAPVRDAAENEASVVLLVEKGQTSVLLTGDAEGDVLDRLAGTGELPDVDVLKVGHHGSEGAVSEPSMAVLTPETAAISVGAGNRFGHPRDDTLGVLEAAGSEVRRTDRDGDLVFELTEETSVRGEVRGSCATLARLPSAPKAVVRERLNRGSQARVPDSQRAEAARRAGRHAPEEARGRRRGPRLQHERVRWRECRYRRGHRREQYAAVHERAPPCGGPQRREDAQGRS